MSARAAAALVVVLLLASCATTQKSTPPEAPPNPPAQDTGALNEDFDPLSLPQLELEIPPKTRTAEREPQPMAEIPQVDTSMVEVAGYQVQLLQTEDATLARAVVRDAASVLATAVDLTFDSPYYKVRAGNFVNRFDAEQLQELATAKGYASAWVVRTKVKGVASELERQ